jgi:HEAT repeat protein
MMRYTLATSLLLVVACATQAAPPDLKGKTLDDTFTELLPGIGKTDNNAPNSAGQKWQDICFALGAPGNEKLREEACKLMIAKLDDKNPKQTRLWMLAQLQRLGNEESIGGIATILDDKDDEVREAAVRAMANNSSLKATAKLTDALGTAKDKAKIGLLNALGHRADPAAIDSIVKSFDASGPAAVAGARALGRIPGPEAVKALSALRAGAKRELDAAIADALLVQADRLLKASKTDDAVAIYKSLNTKDEPKPVRLAALRGTIQCSGDKAGELVLNILTGEDAGEKNIAVGQIENLSAGSLKTLAASIEKLPVPSRVSVITAIAARGDKTQLPIAVAAAKDADPAVKRAGVLALGRLGDASNVEQLLDLMSSKDAVAGVATESLANLPADGVNEKLLAVLAAEKNAARTVALLNILERRKATAAVPALLKAAASDDGGIRTAAFNGLKTLATTEHLPGMVAAFLKTAKGGERDQAELAIVAVAVQNTNAEKRAEPVLAALKDTAKDRAAELLPLLGRLGGTDARKTVREALGSTEPGMHDAAVVAFCNWPDASANEDLLALAEKGKTDAEKLRSLQALIRVNTVLIERTPEERVAALGIMKKAMELATRDDERRAIISGLGFVRHLDTLHYILPYLDQPALAEAACKGIVELAHSKMLREPNKAEFVKVLNRVMMVSKDQGLKDRAKGYRDAP